MDRNDREYQICKSIAYIMRLKYPKVPFHFDYAGNNLSKTQAGRMKSIQGIKAWPDLFIAKPVMTSTGIYHGLFIEVKKEHTRLIKLNGEPADSHIAEQQECLAMLANLDYYCAFGVGLDSCLKIIDDYLTNKL
jgi:hypothetical protein